MQLALFMLQGHMPLQLKHIIMKTTFPHMQLEVGIVCHHLEEVLHKELVYMQTQAPFDASFYCTAQILQSVAGNFKLPFV